MSSNSNDSTLSTTSTSPASAPTGLVYFISSADLRSRRQVSCVSSLTQELYPIYQEALNHGDYALRAMTHQLLQGNLGTSMSPLET